MLTRVTELQTLNDDLRAVLESLPAFVMTIGKDHRITWCSRYANGLTPELVIGKPAIEFVGPEYKETARRAFEECFRTGNPSSYDTSSGGRITSESPMYFSVYVSPIRRGGEIVALSLATQEITDRKRLEAQLRESVDQLKRYAKELEEKNRLLAEENAERERTESALRRQQEVVSALSTPIIQAWDGVLALPIVGALDAPRASQMMEKLLGEIVRTRARFAVLDLTGVDSVDTSTVGHLLGVVRATGLLGSRCLVSGISPAIAQTMVSMGSDAAAFMTFSQMQDALRYALQQEGVRGAASLNRGRALPNYR